MTSINDYIDKIIYINLDRRADRRELIEKQLHEYDISFERFSAIENSTFGAIGCGLSHIAVLEYAKEKQFNNILILEDDFEFIVLKDDLYNYIKALCEPCIHYDVCLLSYNEEYQPAEDTQHPLLKKVSNSQTASGYIVNKHYYDNLISIFKYCIERLNRDNYRTYGIDQGWKLLQKRDTWYRFPERIGIQRPSYSDIEQTHVNYKC
jgi:GR25 family glycosyltransferase involved in LPS biosynthesis